MRSALAAAIRASTAALLLLAAGSARAQTPVPGPGPEAIGRPPDIELNLIDLPTTLSMGRHHSYFRLTHRFARDLRRGDFGNLAADLFSLDSGAVIGLEYRFGITSRLEAGAHRSLLSKTIQTFARYDAVRQGAGSPVGLSITGGVEGTNNLRQQFQPSIGATLSRSFGRAFSGYITPMFVGRTQAADFTAAAGSGTEGTFFAGVGGRARVRPTVYLVGEYSPRISGYRPNKGTWGAAIEKRAGGHTFQLNFTNSFGTTFGQVARGGSPHDVYLGFNLTRKF